MKFLCSLLFIVFAYISHCQADAGCMVSSNIYSNNATIGLGVNLFSDLKLYAISGQPTSCFTGTISTSTACFVCDQGGEVSSAVSVGSLVYLITCNKKTNIAGLGPYYSGVQGTYYSDFELQCPLDDYTWAIALASGTFGLILIRRRIN